jgi:hypothetical protein
LNNENLKKGKATQFKSGDEAVRNGRKGGLQLGENNRKRKLFKDYILSEFDKPTEFNGCVITVKEASAIRLVNMLLDEKISSRVFLKAFEFCRDTIGERPSEKVEFNTIDREQSLKELQEIFNDRG